MRTVNIAELKNRLSTYITYAKAGETVIIRDRKTAVAQLTPMPQEGGMTAEERLLVADGIMSMPIRPLDLDRIRNMPKTIAGNSAIQAIIDDRNEGF